MGRKKKRKKTSDNHPSLVTKSIILAISLAARTLFSSAPQISNLSNGSKKIQDDVLHHPSSSNPPDRGIYSSSFISLPLRSFLHFSTSTIHTIKFSTVGWLSLQRLGLLLVLSGGLKIQQAPAQHLLSTILVFSYRTNLSTAGFSPLLSPVFPSDAIFFSLGLFSLSRA